MSFDDIISNIDALPPLSDAVLKIQNMYALGSDNVEVSKLIKLIESDAFLTTNVLKMANSPMYGFSNKISTVSQAVTLFGIMQIKSFVMSYAIDENLKANMEVYGVTNARFNDMCNLQSALIIQWYSKINISDANLIAPLALIMESGKLILANEIIKSNYKLQFLEGIKNSEDISLYEQSLIGTNSYELSALLFKHWNLDPLYVDILEDTKLDEKIELYTTMLKVVTTAINVKELLTKQSVLKACKVVKTLDLDVEHFVKACVRVKSAYIKDLKQKSLEK